MVPKVAGKGASFKGAGLYYLHDKGADTAARVAFSHTENLPTTDPDQAIKCMAYTAMHQNEIKAANGIPTTGRKLTKPVYAYSLAWAPDETPTQAQMIEAGRDTLKTLGFAEHEALFVAHNDEEHPHLHVIVNRVHPETGKAHNPLNDHLILSRWAEAYEREQGKIRCEERVENNARRKEGEFVKHRKKQLASWRRERGKEAFEKRQAESSQLSAKHKGERQDLYDWKEDRICQVRQEMRDYHRRHWITLFQHQKTERDKLDLAQRTATDRLSNWLKDRTQDRWADDRRGKLSDAFQAVKDRQADRSSLAARQEDERARLADRIGSRTREAIRDINGEYQAELDQLIERQRQDTRTLQQDHSEQSQDRARDIATGRDQEEYKIDTDDSLSGDFKRSVLDRIKEAKERQKEERLKGRDQGREREP